MEGHTPNWQQLNVTGLRPVEKVVAVFHISDTRTKDHKRFPFPLFKVKVTEQRDGSYRATPNVAIKSPAGDADWIGGSGATVEEALEQCLQFFLANISERVDLQDDDFYWADPNWW
jgi:hypothetical protein